mgnify:CR=1 FL=1
MRKSLTKKQKIVLSNVTDLIHKSGRSPTLEQLRSHLRYTRISSVQRHTEALKQKGYLKNSRNLSLPSSQMTAQLPLVGNVAGGQPLLAYENIEAYVPYEKSKIPGNTNDYFFLRVVGDSMNASNINGKAIEDGDYVLVRKQSTANLGTRVVALIGDEATVKKLSRSGNFVTLEPESTNPHNKPIHLVEDPIVQGVVIDVLKGERKYGSQNKTS